MKKIFAVLLAAMMTATAFAGCNGGGGEQSSTASDGSSAASSDASGGNSGLQVDGSFVDESYFGDEDNITLKVWAPDKAVSLVKDQVSAFQEHYSGKKMTIEVVAQGESDAATQVLNDASVAADVFAFPSDQLNQLVDAKVIAEVAFADAVKEQNSEDTVTAATINDTLFAYPETNDNGYYLVYDNTIVTEDDAKTLEGVLEACKKGGKDFVMDCGDGFYACTFAFTAGAKIDGLEEDGTQKFTDYNEDDAVKTIMAFAKLMKDYKGTFKSLNVKQVASGFTNGTCGAGVDGSWDTEVNKTALGEKFGAAKLPTINVDGTDKQLVSMFGYKYIGVNGSSKFPAASQILALYLSGEECAKQRVESLGWGTSNKAVQESDLVKGNAALNAIKEQAANACVQVNIAPTFWQPMGTLGDKIVAEEWDPSDEAKTRKLLQDTIANVRDEG
ncbi:MAG: hypothetical protein U0L58_04850 [Ruminococcus sp.]|nr:hypothetical protein [Ruminococcus sp.]